MSQRKLKYKSSLFHSQDNSFYTFVKLNDIMPVQGSILKVKFQAPNIEKPFFFFFFKQKPKQINN